MTTTLKYVVVTTRKPHRCFCCERVFPKGTNMRYWSVVGDDGFGSGYNCATCEELLTLTDYLNDPYEGYSHGCVYEALNKGQTPEQLLVHEREEKRKREEKQKCLNLGKIK